MPDWLQLALTLTGAVLGGGTLATFATLYFTRRKTAAETNSINADVLTKRAAAHKEDADADRTEAETAQVYLGEIRTAIRQWADCVKEQAETAAENAQLKRTVELLRQENVAKDLTITDLHRRLAE